MLFRSEDLEEEEVEKLDDIVKNYGDLGSAYRLKEKLRQIFNSCENWAYGLLRISNWMRKARYYLPKSCGVIGRWLGEIVAYFDNGTTQGVVEGINNKLKLIKRRGYGFRNFDNFVLRCELSFASVS